MSDAPIPEGLSSPDNQPPPPQVEAHDLPAPDAATADAAPSKRSRRGSKTKEPKAAKEKAAKAPKAPKVKGSKVKGGKQRAVPDEGFDFLAGKFSAAVRTRVMNLVLIAVLVLVGGTLIASAVTAGVSNANDNSATDAARQRNAAVEVDLTQKAASGTATISDVDDHIAARSAIIVQATEGELDIPMIFAAMNNLAPGAEVTSIALGGATPEPAAGAAEPVATTAPADTEAAEKAAKEAENKVTLRGTIESESQAPGLNAALRTLSWAEGGAATLSCGGSDLDPNGRPIAPTASTAACTWDWAGSLTDGAKSTRSIDIPASVARPGSETEQGGN